VKGTPLQLYRSHGCKKCGNIGYKGRMGIHEVMRMSENLERLTVENSSSDELMRSAVSEGMLTLRDDGFAKVLLGQTSIEEILRVVV
jgi:type IV pilus assembly protein PilB